MAATTQVRLLVWTFLQFTHICPAIAQAHTPIHSPQELASPCSYECAGPSRAPSTFGGGESGWCSDVASTHGAWRHAGVRFLLRRVFVVLRETFAAGHKEKLERGGELDRMRKHQQ